MARTLVGRLQLILEAVGLGEAKKVEGAMSSIESRAKRLSTAQWGQNFQRQIEKMALSAKEFDAVRLSWDRLQNDMTTRNLTAALKKSEISGWKTSTISHLTGVRAQLHATERRVHSLTAAMKTLGRVPLVMAGGYTSIYMGGMLGREALTAASESRRVEAEAKYAGLSEDERGKIQTRAKELSEQYRLAYSDVFDMLKETTLSMPSVDAALKSADANARAMLVLDNTLGSGSGVNGIRVFAKSMDLLERLDPDRYVKMLDGYVKMQQILGKDIDPDAYYQATKYSRSGGKVGSDEFMSIYLPMMIAEVGGKNAGTSIRAGFDQFVVGRASKQALAAQQKYGLRDKNGVLTNERQFGENPIKWVYDTLIPALDKRGVNTENKVELARVIGELTSNRLASDEMIGAILNMQQSVRYLEKRVPNAAGLKAADDIQKDNPFAAWRGFKDALENLSTAVMPMEKIGAGLNTFADSINAFARKIQEGDPRLMTGAGILGAGAAAWGAWKVGAAIWGLTTAGTNLNAAAVALQAAAANLSGAAASQGGPWGDLPGGRKKPLGFRDKVGRYGYMIALYDTLANMSTPTKLTDADRAKLIEQKREKDRLLTASTQPGRYVPPSALKRFLLGDAAEPGFGLRDALKVDTGKYVGPGATGATSDLSARLNGIVQETQQAGAAMKDALSVQAKPAVDTGSIAAALEMAKELLRTMTAAGGATGKASTGIDAEMRRAHSDFGVAP